jgi:hypothetical protein
MQEPKSSCNSSIWKFRHFCATSQLADPRRGTWSKSLYDRKLSRVVKSYSAPAVRQLTSPFHFCRRFTIRSPHIQDNLCISIFFYVYEIFSLNLAKQKKACIVALARRFTLSQNGYGTYYVVRIAYYLCKRSKRLARISQKVYLEPKWLR